MGSIITIQAGQCGNQIGEEFWERLCAEHGVGPSGESAKHVENDRKDAFFYESSDGRFFPRAILADLEPRVVSTVAGHRPDLFAPENMFIGSEGGGAGNVWSSGYQKGKENVENLMEIILRESESCDFLDGFILFHSVGGGTGSGLGSFLLEQIRERMPKKSVLSVSIFPNNQDVSDSVVQPYNTVLTLRRLRECADGVIAMDNAALSRLVGDALKVSAPTFNHTNRLASSVVAASTSTLRFPGSRFSNIETVLSMASPIRGCHFLVPSYSPFLENGHTVARKTSCLDVQRRLVLPKSRLMNFEESESNCIISALNFMRGVDSNEVEKSLFRLCQRGSLRFAPWAPPSVQVAIGQAEEPAVSGVLLNNTTGFSRALQRITAQYDRLKMRNAFMDMYRREGEGYIEEFDLARESTQWIIEEYRRAEMSNYVTR